MAPRETGKQRAIRIPLQYYTRPDRLQSWKIRLTVVALVLSVVWWASGFFIPDARFRYSRGPLASVHAMWETDCEACHDPDLRVAIGDSWLSDITGMSWDDAQCRACHAGPKHHENESEEDTPSCAGCHRDHRGRDASLVAVPDAVCVGCHENLPEHMSEDSIFADKVTNFEDDHPAFKVTLPGNGRVAVADAVDPGNLKFPHELHMALGMGMSYTRDKVPLKDIYTERYEARAPGLMQMECSECHALDAGDFRLPDGALAAARLTATRSSGNDMLPITYENQCHECHPVYMPAEDAGAPGNGGPGMVEVPHGLTPEQVKRLVASGISATGSELEIKVRKIVGALFESPAGCGLCHYFDYGNGERSPARSGDLPRSVVPTGVKDVWFDHAVFDHSAHRAVDCKVCHPGATSGGRAGERGDDPSNDVLIPEIDLCRDCHSSDGGASYDCVECHRYHHGGTTKKGFGARERDGIHVFKSTKAFSRGLREAVTEASKPSEED